MNIPTSWVKAGSEVDAPDGRRFRVHVWGWATDHPAAQSVASGRLQRLIGRIRRGEPLPSPYSYGSRPLRQHIIQTLYACEATSPAIITPHSCSTQDP